ncbi:MAG: hypothetical protein IT306_24350 [Chloroflexi bacterium]|nr:hypothetical protein [Chloroflexota bacterium]
MASTTMLACSTCWNPIGAGAQPLRLGDQAYHEVCAPRCRACNGSLSAQDEPRWSYEGRVVWGASGYTVRPTEHWCDTCRELHERDLAFAQD